MTESKPGEVRLTLETTDERELWRAVCCRHSSTAPAQRGWGLAVADDTVLAYRKRCAPEPSDAPDEEPDHLIDPCDLTGEGGGRYATYEEAERFALALVTTNARRLVDRLRELESDEALGIIERRQPPSIPRHLVVQAREKLKAAGLIVAASEVDGVLAEADRLRSSTPEPESGASGMLGASDEAAWLCAEAYGADRECVECQRVVRGCIALDGEFELLVCVKHYDGGSPRVDVEALHAILRAEEAAADPAKTSGPRRAEAWERARRLRSALGGTASSPAHHPANVVNPEKRVVEIKAPGPDQSDGESPTGPGWAVLDVPAWYERAADWLEANEDSFELDKSCCMAFDLDAAVAKLREGQSATANPAAIFDAIAAVKTSASPALRTMTRGNREKCERAIEGCLQGSDDSLAYLAAKSDAATWERRAVSLEESVRRELGAEAKDVPAEDLWLVVQELAAGGSAKLDALIVAVDGVSDEMHRQAEAMGLPASVAQLSDWHDRFREATASTDPMLPGTGAASPGRTKPTAEVRSLRGSLACIIGGFHDRTPEDFRRDTLAFIKRHRAYLEERDAKLRALIGAAETQASSLDDLAVDLKPAKVGPQLSFPALSGAVELHAANLRAAVDAAKDDAPTASDAAPSLEDAAEPGAGPGPGWSLHKLYSVARTRSETSSERYGQALFNTLRQVRPDISSQLRGSSADPFRADVGDEKFERAIEAIESMWPS